MPTKFYISNSKNAAEARAFYATLCAVQALSWGAMFALWVFGYLHIRAALGTDDSGAIRWMGVGIALYTALGGLLTFALPIFYARLGARITHAGALALGGLGLVVVAQAHTIIYLLIGYSITSIGWASISNTPYRLANARVQDGNYARAMAWFNLSVIGPQIGLALALGWLLGHVRPADAILGGGGAMMAGGLLSLALPRDERGP